MRIKFGTRLYYGQRLNLAGHICKTIMNPKPIDREGLIGRFPKRASDSHKGMFGKLLVIGGASGMTGAALLAARAALKIGAGCVHVGLLAEEAPTVDFVQPELMLHRAASAMPDADTIAIGCGMGNSPAAQRLLQDALSGDARLVIDADALNLLAAHRDLQNLLAARTGAALLTPHPAEAARLLCCTTTDIQKDRGASVQRLAETFACPVVLKGANSLCATRGGIYANGTGNPGMSAPGMGDVLTGIVAALIAQGLGMDDALLLGVHLHGAAGDEMAKSGIRLGMTASEVTDRARALLNLWTSQ